MLGGTGNLAGEFQFYQRDLVGLRGPKVAETGSDGKLGKLSDKCSVFEWAPDSFHFITANVFSRLRLDNKYTVYKPNGAAVESAKFDELYQAAFLPQQWQRFPKDRPVSPTVQVEGPKLFKARGASGAAALLARPTAGAGNAVKVQKGPVGGAVVEEPKKKRR